MIWGRRKNKTDRQRDSKSEAEKTPSPVSSSPSFHLSDIFSFSWFSRSKREKQSFPKPNSPPANPPNRFPPISSDQPRFDSGDAPRRRSTGDDENRRRFPSGANISCSARHFSLGELELRPISGYWDWDLDPPPPTLTKLGETRPRRQRMRPKVKIRSPRSGRRKNGWRGLERFATVKRSRDPEKDFRESMVEMIREKEMRRPEEMEMLLACYINLNADEHRGFILKAFRQVLVDINPWWLAAGGGGGGGGCHCCQFCEYC